MSREVSFGFLLEERKNRIKVLVLGPYRTFEGYKGRNKNICLEKLEKLQDFLKEKGFNQTRLVKDWVDEEDVPLDSMDIHFLEKSKHYIDIWAEIIVFCFFKEGNLSGVIREWSHMIEQREKCRCSILIRHDSVDLGSLIKGDIGKERIRESSFKNDKEFLSLAFSGCLNILYNLIP